MIASVKETTATSETFSNFVKCPHCTSDMRKDVTDNPHNHYIGHFTCQNRDCNAHITVCM